MGGILGCLCPGLCLSYLWFFPHFWYSGSFCRHFYIVQFSVEMLQIVSMLRILMCFEYHLTYATVLLCNLCYCMLLCTFGFVLSTQVSETPPS